MYRYDASLIKNVQNLRSLGKTYSEINQELNLKIPKATISKWCRKIVLPKDYAMKISRLNRNNLNKARIIAIKVNNLKRQEFLKNLDELNLSIANRIHNPGAAKIALAMLCLGEASKYRSKTSSFYLGSSDPRIIIIFLSLLKICFSFKIEKVRCTVQCRADQDIKELEDFWMNVTRVPKGQFYKAQIDKRTAGKPTVNKEYKGVLRVDYFDTKVQLELESLSNLIYNQLHK